MPFVAAVNRKKQTKASACLSEAEGGTKENCKNIISFCCQAGHMEILGCPGGRWQDRSPGGALRGIYPQLLGWPAVVHLVFDHLGRLVTFGFWSCTAGAAGSSREESKQSSSEGRQSPGADGLTAVKHPQTELANTTLLKNTALFIFVQDLGNFQCTLGGK